MIKKLQELMDEASRNLKENNENKFILYDFTYVYLIYVTIKYNIVKNRKCYIGYFTFYTIFICSTPVFFVPKFKGTLPLLFG